MNMIDMPEKEYFKAKGVSKSLLAKMDCPAKAYVRSKETPAMMIGSMVHKAILEPDDFDDCYVVAPEINKRTKAGKEEWAEFQAANAERIVITQGQRDHAMGMQDAVQAHQMASELLSEGKAEQSCFWNDGRTGEACKARIDWMRPDNVIVDLKTANSAQPFTFSRSCHDFKYHVQDAWYTRGAKADDFYFIVVEKEAPYVVEVYRSTDEAKALGLVQVDAALDKLRMCKGFNEWGGYNDSDEVNIIDLPPFAY